MTAAFRSAGRRAALALTLALTLSACAGRAPQTAPEAVGTTAGERTAVLLTINDVYRIEGVEGGTVGGLARLRALRRELEREHPGLLLLHSGDFLFPSFASRLFDGEQMVAVLNALDGGPGFDDRLFAVFGNHEFEKDGLEDAPLLDARLGESEFRWLGSNVDFAEGEDGRPLVEDPNLARSALVESGGLRIGLFGVTIPTAGVGYVETFEDPVETARRLTAELRRQGAEVVVALTHLNAADDRRLLETLGAAGPDLIVGGHDHERMVLDAAGRKIVKADADARTAAVIRLTLGAAGALRVEPGFRALEGDSPAPDPEVQALVDEWQERHERAFCGEEGDPPGCLEKVYGRTRTVLEAEENKIRGRETSLGDWVADRMVEAMAACGARAAFINSGSLRLNQDLAAGTEITRRHIEELFAYPAPLRLVRIDGATLQWVLDHTVSRWPGSGSWLQVSGFAYEHDPESRAARNLTLLAPEGARPVQPDEEILVAVNDFLVNPQIGDQDGYGEMLPPSRIVAGCAADGRDLKDVVVEALKAAEPRGIAPEAEGRICQPDDNRPCLTVPAAEGR